jgi:LysR family hydrogen peroxide-inducible transcriptional activator
VLPTIAPYLLPPVMARFSAQFGGVDLTVHEDTTAQLLKLVHAYEIDFAVASEPIVDDRLTVTELFTEELVAGPAAKTSRWPKNARSRPRTCATSS